MSNVVKTIHVPDDSELGRLLQEADQIELRLEQHGVTYRVSREDNDPWATYDPDAVRSGMEATAGALTPEQAEEIKRYIYQGREEGTRPVNRP
jgi:hypothetical protein